MNLLNFESILLDMDGTLLDGYFDDLFWNDWVAKAYATRTGLPLHQARTKVQSDLKAVAGQFAWYDFDRWACHFGLDLASLQDPRPRPHSMSTGNPCATRLCHRPQGAHDSHDQRPPQSLSL